VIGVVVDVDDTIVNTQRRIRAVWQHVLGKELDLDAVESLSSRQILERFGGSNEDTWTRFWSVLLCSNKAGIKFLRFDEPIPFAAEVLKSWSERCLLVYLTGRPENMRDLTLTQFERFGFPTRNARLVMFGEKDWESFVSVESVVEVRTRVFSDVANDCDVVRVVDDTPRFFSVYKKFTVPDRVGFLRMKRFVPKDYFDYGATRVVENWRQLQGDVSTLTNITPHDDASQP